MIEVANLHKRYGTKVAVEDVSFDVQRGEIFGILGPNGAGKTTTVECVEGLRRADRGSLRVLGLDPVADGPLLHQRLGAQVQSGALPDRLRVGEALELYASFYPRPAPPRQLARMLALTERWSTPWKKLSGGQQQRLSIALALIGRPEVAILDELTTGLDPQGRRDTWALIEGIRDQGVTIVLVTHLMEEAERLCDRVALINAGRVVTIDTPAGLAGGGRAQTLAFRPSRPFDERLLTDLATVARVEHRHDRLVVTGSDDVVQAVVATLARHDIVAEGLRVDQPSLEEAYLSLTTGHALAASEGEDR